MFDSYLIQYCAPTLAGIKNGSLFQFPVSSHKELNKQLDDVNKRLNPKGIVVTPLRENQTAALILVYRKQKLERELKADQIQRFLKALGYQDGSAEGVLKEISDRLTKPDVFPHEIGLLLQYPLRDVIGFMRNQGKNSRCTGCWKVYGDERESRHRFEAYKRCTDCYWKQFNLGKSVVQLTVTTS